MARQYHQETMSEPTIQWTGERYIPGFGGPEIQYEHEHRYQLAAALVQDKAVLDIGCGEGYGSQFLASNAAHVTGIDVDVAAIEHARARYRSHGARLKFEHISSDALYPFENQSFDVITCFEVIEHLPSHELLLSEARRLLKPDGVFLVSTPDRKTYSDDRNYKNEFHLSEMYIPDFHNELSSYFSTVSLFMQAVHAGSIVLPLDNSSSQANQDEIRLVIGGTGSLKPMYVIAICSQSPLSLDVASIYADSDDTLLNSYRGSLPREEVDRLLSEFQSEREKAQGQLTEYENELLARANALQSADLEVARLRAIVEQLQRD